MDIYAFDKDLNLQGVLESYFSLIWIRRYSKIGRFEIHCALNSKNLSLLKKNNIVWKNDSDEAGYIEHINLRLDDNGNEILIVKGKFLTGLLNRRIIWETKNFNTRIELAIRELVDENAINPTDANRKINFFELGSLNNLTENIDYQVSYNNLANEIIDLAIMSDLGLKTSINLNNKKMIFNVYKGLDRTIDQDINSTALFSKEFENILEQEYTSNLENYRSIALIAGEGEGTARVLTTTGTGIGLDRHEIFIDARDLKSEGMTSLEYKEKLKERGNVKLADWVSIETFESKVNLKSNLEYKKDFDLGDLVTYTSKSWGITINARIIEVEEIYEQQGKSINLIFGDSIPTLADKIKAVI